MGEIGCQWDAWVEQALLNLQSLNRRISLRPIHLSSGVGVSNSFQFFDGPTAYDRGTVEINISESTFHKWLDNIPSSGDENDGEANSKLRKLIAFSGNDYLGLSSHPAVCNAAAKAALDHGMGPRSSAILCGYTNFHRLLESSLAELKRKEDCLLCPSGFSACVAFLVTVGSLGSFISTAANLSNSDRVAIFSDALNHASIIDGIRLAMKQGNSISYVYRHCDMSHLDSLLSSCSMKKKVVVTDSLFSVDGDFAPMVELAKLRKKHGFLLVIDDAHGTLVCGRNGRGTAEMFNCEEDVDICISGLNKAIGCQGGFIACSKKWKLLMLCLARSFIFTTSITVPDAAAAYAAVKVAKKEAWRRHVLWERVKDFHALTGMPTESHIIPIIVGTEGKALQASRELLKAGFHVHPLRPPIVPPNSCRLRVSLSAGHTKEDLVKFTNALSQFVNFKDTSPSNSNSNSNSNSKL